MPSFKSFLLHRVSPVCLCVAAGWGTAAMAQTVLPDATPVHAHETTQHDGHEWGYTGPEGAEHWAELAKENALCGNGQQNSPIDLKDAIDATLGKLKLDYGAVPLVVRNTGHSIQLDLHAGGTMRVGGKQYDALQLHFHHPSEHLLKGRRFPMEAHIVHQGPDGTLGVLAIFFETGKANPAFQRVLDAMPSDKNQTRQVADALVRASDFLPPANQRSFYRYEGSLTTPPCSETVDWVVLSQPVQVSREQINAFERVYPFNARPLQPLDRRFLLKSH
ncbi:carbonic anhydrase [Xanthomonas campestris]|uniref:carbonic anhydrase n=1 Tax=Xanthomonas campestris TaxID=339 RepID=UPI00094B54CE|nr:carbonic anhydrase family protein [Xanthomonas campestris]MEA0763467.1 carbonic anhydrase family protein [Xanthomonas campestris pv. campestris]MEB1225181.1 carbonic anhydrase family protein [Xanthomonas campestris pv. campestris]MEB1245871.1 carbonic anhydrase family protein [Xanthomonas campestris pv. campestris]MEB1254164.1 carbonic anhydrase family protein [Xanthomonas campestris pv. campestris]MEB1262528.1 carbonic anhydrase family protein [Xanthomonas campestris pv. campestris]